MSAVSDLLRHTANSVVMPIFHNLAHAETRMKAAGEPVTVADDRAEAMITSALMALLPGSRVIGEEACSGSPTLL